jgi:hypothetical protein
MAQTAPGPARATAPQTMFLTMVRIWYGMMVDLLDF